MPDSPDPTDSSTSVGVGEGSQEKTQIWQAAAGYEPPPIAQRSSPAAEGPNLRNIVIALVAFAAIIGAMVLAFIH